MTGNEYDQVPAVVREALERAGSHDTSSFLGCFAEDGEVDDWGRIFTGHDQIRRWSDAEFIGKNVILSDLRFSGDGDHIVVHANVGGDGYTGPSTFTFILREGKIRLLRITA
jgi:hypothetical protein